METRGRAYRRYRRHLAIVHKKGLSRRLIGEDWFQVDGKYSKGHIPGPGRYALHLHGEFFHTYDRTGKTGLENILDYTPPLFPPTGCLYGSLLAFSFLQSLGNRDVNSYGHVLSSLLLQDIHSLAITAPHDSWCG